jgi:hypothetical protein
MHHNLLSSFKFSRFCFILSSSRIIQLDYPVLPLKVSIGDFLKITSIFKGHARGPEVYYKNTLTITALLE